MTDDLVKRLENVRCDGVEELCWEAADRIEELEAKLAKAVKALDDALLTGYFGDNQDEHSRLWDVYEELTGGKE